MPPSSPELAELTEWSASAVEIELSRDYEPTTARVPGMSLGTRRITGRWEPLVAEFYHLGVRQVRIADPVDLCPDAGVVAARTLVLLRELTAYAISVDWVARCHDGCAGRGLFNHLCPPARVDGVDDDAAVRGWQTSFFLGMCVSRRGPGFTEVRDRRLGTLEMYTIDEPAHLAAITELAEGVPAGQLPVPVREELTEARLVAEQSGYLWWLPTRAYRWPSPALSV